MLSKLDEKEFLKWTLPTVRITSKGELSIQWATSITALREFYKKEEVIYDIN